ncbi:MAG: efflux RND transporter periplasmic adaptor subunit [Saccharospirillum sp.]
MVRLLIRITLPLLILAGGAGLVYLLVNNPVRSVEASDTLVDPLADAATVETFSPANGEISPQLQLYARYQSQQSVRISSPVASEVLAVVARVGDRVDSGDTLVQLDDTELSRQVAQLEARRQDLQSRLQIERRQHQSNQEALAVERNLVDIAERSVNRLRNLRSQNLSSAADLENAERHYQSQRLTLQQRELAIARFEDVERQFEAQLAELDSQLEQARSNRDDATIKAPFSGRVSDIQVQNGATVGVGAVLMTLVDDRQTELVAWAASPALSQADQRIGLTGHLDHPQGPVAVTLQRVDPAAQGGALELFFELDQPNPDLVLNRTYRLWLDLPRVSAVAVPDSSLYANSHIYQVIDDRLRRVPVRLLGERFEDGQLWRLIDAELEPDAPVLSTRLQDAAEGLAVKVNQP